MGTVALIFGIINFVKLSCKDQFFNAMNENKLDLLKGLIILNDVGSSGTGISTDDSKDRKTIIPAKIVIGENLISLYLNHK